MQGVDGTPLSRHAEPDDVARAANRKAAAPAAWAAVPMTPRPCAEPSLNHWLGLTLGDPDALVARVVEQDTGASVAVVSAADLALHPLLLPLLTVGLTGSLFHEIREVSIGLRDGIRAGWSYQVQPSLMGHSFRDAPEAVQLAAVRPTRSALTCQSRTAEAWS
jgi:hypothetical protein